MVSRNPILIVTNQEHFAQETELAFKKVMPAGTAFKQVGLEDALMFPNSATPPFIIIDLTAPPENFPQILQNILARFACRIVGSGQPAEVQALLTYLKMGIKDFISFPYDGAEIETLLNQIRAANVAMDKPLTEGRIITLHSPKGGTGVTFLTTNLAVALAKAGSKVAIIDLSLECGDACTFLNLTANYTVRDVIDNTQLLDASFLEGVLVEHPASGVRILPAPREDQAPILMENIAALKSILQLMKEHHDFVLIDAGHFNPSLLHYLFAESDHILVMGNPDVASLRGLVNLVRKLSGLHYEPHKIKVIMNRHNSKNQVDSKEFEKMTQHTITSYLPNNYQLCIQAVNTGKPIGEISESSDLAKKITELAHMIRKGFSTEESVSDGGPGKPLAFIKAKKGLFRCF